MLLTPVINIPVPLIFKSLDVYAIIFFMGYVFLTFFQKNVKNNRILSLVFFTYTLLLVQLLLLEVLYGFGDSTGIAMILRGSFTVLAAYGCAQFLIDRFQGQSLEIFLKIVIICALVQGVVLWLSFMSPFFRELMSQFFYRDLDRGADHLILLRTPGFVPSGGDGLSMNQSLLTTVGLLGAYICFSKRRYQLVLLGLLLVSMFSAMFAGRSGFYLGVIGAIAIIFTQKNNFQIIRKLHKFLIAAVFFVCLIFLFSNQLGNYGQQLLDEYGYEYPLVRLLRGFIEMQASGQYTDRTFETLTTRMVLIPEDPMRFLIGDNDFGRRHENLLKTDVGYFRMWHGFGLVGLIVYIFGVHFLPLSLLYNVSRSTRNNLQDRKVTGYLTAIFQMVLYVLIFGLIGHYKIFYLSTRIYLFLFFSLLFLVFFQHRMLRSQVVVSDSQN
ncbi:MAG: hypothetical protein ACNA8H_08960 [Anaerolineales bacterium]